MYIELRRHSTKQGTGNSDLSSEGIELAKNIGSDQLRGKGFTHFYVSPVTRTQQTMKLFAQGATDFGEIRESLFLGEQSPLSSDKALELWGGVCHEAEDAGEDMMLAALERAPEVTNTLVQESAKAFLKWVKEMPEKAKVLVVNHSPAIEILILGLTGTVIKQLEPCEGVKLSIDQGEVSFEEIRLN